MKTKKAGGYDRGSQIQRRGVSILVHEKRRFDGKAELEVRLWT